MGNAIKCFLEVQEQEGASGGAIILIVVHEGLSSNDMGASISGGDKSFLMMSNNLRKDKSKPLGPDFIQDLEVRVDQRDWTIVSRVGRFIYFWNKNRKELPIRGGRFNSRIRKIPINRKEDGEEFITML